MAALSQVLDSRALASKTRPSKARFISYRIHAALKSCSSTAPRNPGRPAEPRAKPFEQRKRAGQVRPALQIKQSC